MANSDKSNPSTDGESQAPAIVADGCVLKGELILQGPLHINGTIEGNIKTLGQVLIGAKGEVRGNIEAKHMVLAGRFSDGVAFVQQAELLSGAVFEGDLHASKCSCEAGGKITGTVRMVPIVKAE